MEGRRKRYAFFQQKTLVWIVLEDESVYQYNVEHWPEQMHDSLWNVVRDRALTMALDGMNVLSDLKIPVSCSETQFFEALDGYFRLRTSGVIE